jgi:hypothetical protein
MVATPKKILNRFIWFIFFSVLISGSTTSEVFENNHVSNHILSGVGTALVISGSESGERAKAMQARFKQLGSDNAPPLHIVSGVSGEKLSLIITQKDVADDGISFIEENLGLKVQLWDWREGGLGGAGMSSKTVARIAACASSHILAAREAWRINKWPALILEDDIIFDSLLDYSQSKSKGGSGGAGGSMIRTLVQEANSACDEWGIIQLGYLIPSAQVAVSGIMNHLKSGKQLRLRDPCSADHKIVNMDNNFPFLSLSVSQSINNDMCKFC